MSVQKEPRKMFGHADGNSFYCSVETIYKPWLRERPIIVASNNDLCAISINTQAKALGITMATPIYEITDLIKQHGVLVFSSHYELYAEISNRMMCFFSQFVENLEVYSIDEAFLDFTGYDNYSLNEYGKKIVRGAAKNLRIPICLGIAPTKVLAKAANKLAKKDSVRKGLYVIDTEEDRIQALKELPIGSVWGIGHAYEEFLISNNVETAYDFACKPQSWVRKHMTVVGERLWMELNGIPCLSLELIPPDKKEMCTSRMFNKPVTEFEDLKAAMVSYLDSCARKLRKQKSYTQLIYVAVVVGNKADKSKERYRGLAIDLPVATNNTIEMIPYAVRILKTIYDHHNSGPTKCQFKKASVTLGRITPANARQLSLFDPIDNRFREKITRLQTTVDEINAGLNLDGRLIQLAVEHTNNDHIKLRRQLLSANPLVNWNDRIVIDSSIK